MLVKTGNNDGLSANRDGTGLVEINRGQQEQAASADKITFKVKMGTKTKAVSCTDFANFQYCLAEAFAVNIRDYEVIILDEEDEREFNTRVNPCLKITNWLLD